MRRGGSQRLVGGAAAFFNSSQAKGGVDEAELYQVFNMGIGMTVIVAAGQGGCGAAIHPRPKTSAPG